MKSNINIFLTTITCLFLFVTFPEKTFAQDKPETIYQCAPCACSSDDKHFDKPGSCPSCGMKLVAVTEPFNSLKDLDKPMNVAILLFNHAQVLDYAGPYDVFTSAGRKNFNVYTVASTKEAITTMPNLSVNPQYTILNCPKPDVLIIPGGMWTSVGEETLEWIKKNSTYADYTFSVCTGAFILAEIGILDGLEATTHSAGIDILEKKYPAIKKVHSNMRFVDNGNVITSAGVSAGIDASFHLIVKILGEDWAEAIATNLEYKYEPHKSPNKHN
jgi:transcriptional regulator GlxA family with amidase domain/DNA-directed RNA polymerase subunit RPC12/RpoP